MKIDTIDVKIFIENCSPTPINTTNLLSIIISKNVSQIQFLLYLDFIFEKTDIFMTFEDRLLMLFYK